MDIQKMGTKYNPAGLMTKHLDGMTAAGHLKRLIARTTSGWHELAPKLWIRRACAGAEMMKKCL